jgi:hypothetical protein
LQEYERQFKAGEISLGRLMQLQNPNYGLTQVKSTNANVSGSGRYETSNVATTSKSATKI